MADPSTKHGLSERACHFYYQSRQMQIQVQKLSSSFTCWVSFWLRHHPNASHISFVVVSGVQYPTRIDATAQNISSLALCPESTGSVSSPLVSASTSSLLSGSPASQQSQFTMVLLHFRPTGDAHSGSFIESKISSILCMCTLCTPALYYMHAAAWKHSTSICNTDSACHVKWVPRVRSSCCDHVKL